MQSVPDSEVQSHSQLLYKQCVGTSHPQTEVFWTGLSFCAGSAEVEWRVHGSPLLVEEVWVVVEVLLQQAMNY